MFFILVLGITLSINSYVFLRGWQVLPPLFIVRFLYTVAFWGMTSVFFLRMYKGDVFSPSLSLLLSEVGFTWLIAVIYLAMFALVIDVLRIANHFTGFFPLAVTTNPIVAARLTGAVVVLTVTSLLVHGYYKFNNPQVTRLEINIEKPLPKNALRIVLISDIHLSSYINGDHLDMYVTMINNEEPDLVLIAGDIADMNLKPMKEWNISERFKRIQSRYGVYAISGNHEFYGGEREEIYNYIRSSGINLLIDSVALAAGGIQIVGRDDRTNHNRLPLDQLMEGVDLKLPVILLDHQPFGLEEAQQYGVDLQLSGHTHNGQFWPGNLIVNAMYEIAYGYGQKGKTHYYVTSGIGLWGPKFRIGTVSEIVVIDMKNGG